MPNTPDKELVSQCLAGNHDAWSRLYHRMYKTVYLITHWEKWHFSHDEAEEIMQEVFMSLITALKTFNFDCSLETFVSNIAKNNCISAIRKITAAKRVREKDSISLDNPQDQGNLRDVMEDKQSSLEEQSEKTELQAMLQSTLDTIDERCRTIIKLKYFKNHSYEEIAAILQLSIGTVASRLKRCLLELRSLCKRHMGELL